MNKLAGALLALLAVTPAFAVKPCEELKSEIVAKLEAKGVKNYQVDIVPTDAVKDQTVIGSCEGGMKKITYRKDSPPPAPGTPKPR